MKAKLSLLIGRALISSEARCNSVFLLIMLETVIVAASAVSVSLAAEAGRKLAFILSKRMELEWFVSISLLKRIRRCEYKGWKLPTDCTTFLHVRLCWILFSNGRSLKLRTGYYCQLHYIPQELLWGFLSERDHKQLFNFSDINVTAHGPR